MSSLFFNSASAVWLLLVSATCLTGWLAETERGVRWASIVMLSIASVKIWLILWNYMELKTAPLPWRIALSAWLAVVTAIVLSVYWPPIG